MGAGGGKELHAAIEAGDLEKCKEQLEANKAEEDAEKKWSVDDLVERFDTESYSDFSAK